MREAQRVSFLDEKPRFIALRASDEAEKRSDTSGRMLRDEGVVVESTWSVMDAVARCGWAMRARETGAANDRNTTSYRGTGAAEDRNATDYRETGTATDRTAVDYREIDRELRRIAKRKAALDIEEATWLREAEKQRIWRKLGYSTALEYLEDVFGYAPRTAMERLRVAKELGDLPALEAAVRDGELPYSAARELTRVMTPDTEAAWLTSARGKNLRDIEELVAGRKKGDTPDAEKNPELVKRKRVLELSPRVDALVEQCRAVLANELGSHVDDEVLTETLCRCFLAGGAVEGDTGDTNAGAENGKTTKAKAPRPANRIVSFKCESCARAWQQSRGRMVELTADEIALAECDCETVYWADESCLEQSEQLATPQTEQRAPREPSPSVDRLVEAPGTPTLEPRSMPRLQQRITPNLSQRATPNIPQRIRNLVWARDRGRCRVPGCRATRCLDVHHIRPRSEGGDHDPANLVVLCSGHHKLHHAGLLSIRGRAPDQLVFMRDGKVLVDARSPEQTNASEVLRQQAVTSRFADVTRREHAKQALVQLGYKSRAAGAAVDEASAHVGSDADVGTIVKAALARGAAPRPTDEEDPVDLARQALVQAGFSSATASQAVERAAAHVGTGVELGELIKEALRWCR